MRIYVGNLPWSMTESQVRTLFAEFGHVADCALVKDRETGRSRGYAFVDMPTAGEAQEAMAALHGQEFGGRRLTVNEARPRQPQAPRSRGGEESDYGRAYDR